MDLIKKIDRVVEKVEAFILSSSIILMATILIGNVIARRVFNNSWTFAEEVGQLLVVIVTFMGLGYGVRKGQHVNMSAIIDIAPRKGKKIMAIFIAFISMVTMFFFAYLSYKYTLTVIARGRVTPALEMPRYFTTMFLPIGFTLGGIQYLINLVLNLTNKDDIYFSNEAPMVDYDEIPEIQPEGVDAKQNAKKEMKS
ncbi:MAG: TRAP transporter small permease [Tissierella sp.]|uniref:TRAP transporter small permease n=1 Tax=Tissierella sp. TaxID=41274 RepID=UPI003F9AD1AF